MNRTLIRKTLFVLAMVLASAFAIVHSPLQLGLDLRGGASLIVRVKAEDSNPAQLREVVEQTRQILERRINAYGLAEAPVQPYGSRGNELLVQLPGVSDPSRIRNLLQSRAVLEWYAVEDGPYTSMQDAMTQHGGLLPFNRKLLPTRQGTDGQQAWYLLGRQPIIRGTDLRDARVSAGTMEQPVTTFTLSQDAAKRFEQYTQAHIGRRSAIVLDQEILSVPVIEDAIRDSGQIRGARTLEEAQDLAVNLRSGALPAAIEVVQERTVEASLGADSIRHGLRAGAVGLAAVVATMLLYYRWAGANATLALALNGVLLIAALACFGAVLTLPGIAGVVLTIGMAVDSNVLIFERIREELRAGKAAGAALAAGFSKAFGTLVDTHVTTVVSCAFLFFFGTPAVKGFAATLVIGLVTNLFTSVFVSRVAFDWELSRRRQGGELSIGLAR
ncbi:MAG TPA: protein translocase subunit SecD [Bryobacteraceae bacterium]|jgi:preprotein translocase subunit SecD|nr:protein translocase subunit SecD [Bryobacteraceae bacterium]